VVVLKISNDGRQWLGADWFDGTNLRLTDSSGHPCKVELLGSRRIGLANGKSEWFELRVADGEPVAPPWTMDIDIGEGPFRASVQVQGVTPIRL
jgi:hypothetical protein